MYHRASRPDPEVIGEVVVHYGERGGRFSEGSVRGQRKYYTEEELKQLRQEAKQVQKSEKQGEGMPGGWKNGLKTAFKQGYIAAIDEIAENMRKAGREKEFKALLTKLRARKHHD